MPSSDTEFPIKSIRWKKRQNGKPSTSSRHLARQTSMTNPRVEVYYGISSASVPFSWESQPGIPKTRSHESRPLPPLTPPPSFHSSPARKQSKSNLLNALLPKLSLMMKPQIPPSSSTSRVESPSCSSSSSSSARSSSASFSVPSSPYAGFSNLPENSRVLSPRSSFDSRMYVEDVKHERSPVSTLCFGFSSSTSTNSRQYRFKF